jgi:ribosomal subunit interface protein
MNIQITSRKFKARDSLKEFINDEVKSLEKFYDEIHDAEVILSYVPMKDNEKTAEIILKVPGKTLSATETTDDFNKAVSFAKDKLERQLKKIKSKEIDKKK